MVLPVQHGCMVVLRVQRGRMVVLRVQRGRMVVLRVRLVVWLGVAVVGDDRDIEVN